MQLDVLGYKLPLAAPLELGGELQSYRLGLLLAARSESFNGIAWGELSPLPGVSSETLKSAQNQLLQFLHERKKSGFLFEKRWAAFESLLENHRTLSPSVRFALEMLHLQWEHLRGQFSAPLQLKDTPRLPTVPLLKLSEPAVLLPELQKHQKDPTCLELEVQVQTLAQKPMLEFLLKSLREDQSLRLSGGCAFSFEEAQALLRGLPSSKISFFREPLHLNCPLPLLERLSRDFGIPYALDERLRGLDPREIPWNSTRLKALIYHPMLQGDFSELNRLSVEAFRHHKALILSATYESPIGLQFLGALSSALAYPAAPSLDTERIFARRVLEAVAQSKRMLELWHEAGWLFGVQSFEFLDPEEELFI